MKYFNCDYNEGMVPQILERLVDTNMEQTASYTEDKYSDIARAKIKEECQADVDVHFFVGGTQTNLTFINSALRSHQGVISANCGHINVHETGAIENCGHKIIALPAPEGKITAEQVQKVYDDHKNDESKIHAVQPKLVYISDSTEWGTTYSKEELADLYAVCQKCEFILYIDGARLAYALADPINDMDLPFMAAHCDAFYIGGTKCGAMFGEALVLVEEKLKADFKYLIKQKGALLAKGRMLGLQFDTLFTDNLYQKVGEHGVAMAAIIRDACQQAGYEFFVKNETNQIFPIIPTEKLEELKDKYRFMKMHEVKQGHIAVRFCTSWATIKADVDELALDLKK